MPKRVPQHALEDKSFAKLELSIPDNWVLRKKENDYGIDAEIEIFDDSGNSTGLYFWVQLKATNAKDKGTIKNFDFKISTLNYYYSLNTPILLVRYSSTLDKIFVKWVYNVDLTECKPDSKTKRINLSDSDELNTQKQEEIKKKLIRRRLIYSGSLILPLSYTIEFNEKISKDYSNELYKIKLQNQLSSHDRFLKPRRADSLLLISMSKDKIYIDLSGESTCVFHNVDINNFELVCVKILIGTSRILGYLNKNELCAKFIFDNSLESYIFQNIDLYQFVLSRILESSYAPKILPVIRKSAMNNSIDFVLGMKAVLENSHTYISFEELEDFFKSLLSDAIEINDKGKISICQYNLGSFYRVNHKHKSAFQYFNLARKTNPDYLKKEYFNFEIGAVLFNLERYFLSTQFYSKALQLNTDITVLAFLGDALMFSGRYSDALKKFNEYNKKSSKISDEFRLKILCLEMLNNSGITQQSRQTKEAISYLITLHESSVKTTIEDYNNVLKLDYLNSDAWFNQGIIYTNSKNYFLAFVPFLMSALIDKFDSEPWVNSCVCCWNSEKYINLLPMIIITGHKYCGNTFKEELFEAFELSTSKPIAEFVKFVDSLTPDEKSKSKPIMRIETDEGTKNLFGN